MQATSAEAQQREQGALQINKDYQQQLEEACALEQDANDRLARAHEQITGLQQEVPAPIHTLGSVLKPPSESSGVRKVSSALSDFWAWCASICLSDERSIWQSILGIDCVLRRPAPKYRQV